jgi:hypothetical protein
LLTWHLTNMDEASLICYLEIQYSTFDPFRFRPLSLPFDPFRFRTFDPFRFRAFSQFAKARGVDHKQVTPQAANLRPTQEGYDPRKVAKAKGFDNSRSILVSSENPNPSGPVKSSFLSVTGFSSCLPPWSLAELEPARDLFFRSPHLPDQNLFHMVDVTPSSQPCDHSPEAKAVPSRSSHGARGELCQVRDCP